MNQKQVYVAGELDRVEKLPVRSVECIGCKCWFNATPAGDEYCSQCRVERARSRQLAALRQGVPVSGLGFFRRVLRRG